MIDGGVLAGYLAVAASRAAGKVFDRTVDALFDRLAGRIAQRFGGDAVSRVMAQPGDVARQRQLGQAIEAVARLDPQLAHELSQLQRQLDQRVGRDMIVNSVRAHTNIQTFGGGHAVGGDFNQYNIGSDPSDLSRAPAWVRLLVVVGTLVCLVGFGIALTGILGFIGDVGSGASPSLENALPGFGVFFVGVIILAVGQLGRSMSSRH